MGKTNKDVAEYLTADEAAKLMHHCVRTLERWRVRGGGPPYIRLGGGRSRILYKREDVVAWLDCHRVQSTSEYS